MQITICEYDPAWTHAFQRIKNELLATLKDVPITSIEHVGSTAIPGLAAKPIIDIDIIVEPKYMPITCALLSTNGYTYNPEPWGIDRMSFRYDKHTHDAGATQPTEDGDIRRAVYVNIPTGESLKSHFLVKSALSKFPELVAEYSEIKRELAKKDFSGIGAYGGAKTAILQKIMSKGDLVVYEGFAINQVNGVLDADAQGSK
jgi:GrpB-like predicted nucleotidyltransferase (UPF0157 family)